MPTRSRWYRMQNNSRIWSESKKESFWWSSAYSGTRIDVNGWHRGTKERALFMICRTDGSEQQQNCVHASCESGETNMLGMRETCIGISVFGGKWVLGSTSGWCQICLWNSWTLAFIQDGMRRASAFLAQSGIPQIANEVWQIFPLTELLSPKKHPMKINAI